MRRSETPKIYKKAAIIGVIVLIVLSCIYIFNYTPRQDMEIGEYKNYTIR